MTRPLSDKVLLSLAKIALEQQHQAIDLLLAMMLQRDSTFRPTQLPAVWNAVANGHATIEALRMRVPKAERPT